MQHSRLVTGTLAAALMLPAAAFAAPPGGEEGPGQIRPPERRPDLVSRAVGAWRYEPDSGARYASDHIVVKFDAALPQAMRQQVTLSLGGREYVPSRFSDFGRVLVASGESASALVERFRSNPDVVYAELDPIVHLAAREAVSASATDDPFFETQWHLPRIRQPELEGVNTTRGFGIIVAVLDTGVATTRSDCRPGTSYRNSQGFDLAQTSATKFVLGFDFIDDDNNPQDEGSGDGSPLSDRFGHGTFTATVLAAAADNQYMGAGVAPAVRILPLRVLGRDGFGTFSGVAEAIDFAVANGAKVINMSLGGSSGSNTIANAVASAHAAGVVLVAASGNDSETNGVDFPAAYPQVIAVGATAFDDTRASYSDAGNQLDIMAPGGEDPFQVVGPNDQRDAVLAASFLVQPTLASSICGGFFATGTSFATPQVAAAAALLASLGVDDPDLIQTLLQVGARDIGSPGIDNLTAHGLLDLFEAHKGFGFSFE